MQDGFAKTWPLTILRVEAACIFGASLWAYNRFSGLSWWVFAGGLFLPDLAMTGYLADTTLGAACYNTTHNETPALLVACAGLALRKPGVVGTGLIWLAHIGMDRMLGYGLKYGTGFKHTHLGVIGH